MKIALGCDHRGLDRKQDIKNLLTEMGYDYHDFGCYDDESVDYPDIAQEVAKAVVSGQFDHGILICSTGIGMSIAANKVRGIRAALCCSILSACRARQHNNANILCLDGEATGQGLALNIVKAYLSSDFEGGRHLQRLNKIHSEEIASLDNE